MPPLLSRLAGGQPLICLEGRAWVEYTTAVVCLRVTGGGAAPFVNFKGCGGFLLHEEQAETVLRQEGSALPHLQLLPEKTFPRISARQECVRENSWGSAKTVSVFGSWLCADARACASLGERARKRLAVEGFASIEGEIELHACESGAEKACEASEGLGVE